MKQHTIILGVKVRYHKGYIYILEILFNSYGAQLKWDKLAHAIFDDNSNMAMPFSKSIDFILKAKPGKPL